MPTGKPSRAQRGNRGHTFRDVDGRRRPKAAFAGEPEAHAAANRVFALTGRRYSTYPCGAVGCDAWHIRPRWRRPAEMARPA